MGGVPFCNPNRFTHAKPVLREGILIQKGADGKGEEHDGDSD